MNREEAIKIFSGIASLAKINTEPTMSVCNIKNEVFTEIQALLSPQPDPITGLVPCDFCTDAFNQKPLLQENKYKPYTCMMSTISIEENNGKHQIEIDLWDGGNVYAAFEINYCPMCGRKLTAPPRPGAIGTETGKMAPNGEGAEE